MKDLLEYIVKSLVDSPEQVNINEVAGEQSTIYEVRVAEDDMGKVIGKQGRVAKAIRTVIRSIAAKQEKKVIVEII